MYIHHLIKNTRGASTNVWLIFYYNSRGQKSIWKNFIWMYDFLLKRSISKFTFLPSKLFICCLWRSIQSQFWWSKNRWFCNHFLFSLCFTSLFDFNQMIFFFTNKWNLVVSIFLMQEIIHTHYFFLNSIFHIFPSRTKGRVQLQYGSLEIW